MSVLIRPALIADLEPLTALSRRTISASYRSFLGDEGVDGFLNSGASDQYVAANIAEATVIEQEESPVGYAVGLENLVDLVMIDHRFHRQGLGSLLLHHVERQMFERFSELKLESFAENSPANSFYRKSGWQESSRFQENHSGSEKIVFIKPRF